MADKFPVAAKLRSRVKAKSEHFSGKRRGKNRKYRKIPMSVSKSQTKMAILWKQKHIVSQGMPSHTSVATSIGKT